MLLHFFPLITIDYPVNLLVMGWKKVKKGLPVVKRHHKFALPRHLPQLRSHAFPNKTVSADNDNHKKNGFRQK
jgi:hypothetical protein